jgi:hypothetical protein
MSLDAVHFTGDSLIRTGGSHLIIEGYSLKDRCQFMVAIGSAASDTQGEVDLPRNADANGF